MFYYKFVHSIIRIWHLENSPEKWDIIFRNPNDHFISEHIHNDSFKLWLLRDKMIIGIYRDEEQGQQTYNVRNKVDINVKMQ